MAEEAEIRRARPPGDAGGAPREKGFYGAQAFSIGLCLSSLQG